MFPPAFEHVRAEIPSLFESVNNVSKIIYQHQVEVAVPPDYRFEQPVITIHRSRKHRLGEGVSKIGWQIRVLGNIQDRVVLEFETGTSWIFQNVNILQDRCHRT